MELHRQRNLLYFGGTAWDLAVLLLLIRTGAGRRIRDAVERRTASRFLTGVSTAAALLALLWVAGLPFMIYRHWMNLSYGLSVHPWLPWWLDAVKAAIVTGVPAALLIAGALALVRRSPRRWWMYAWLAGVATMIAATYAAPLVFDPLFFQFRPLAELHPELVRPLQEVAGRGGYEIPPERIFEMDASRKTPTMNAYMTGVGASRRIVIWDTTIAALQPPQVQTVFAHELGHYALNHIPKSIAVASAGLLILLWTLHRFIRTLDDPSALPSVFAVILVASFLADPAANTYSRWQEHQADIYELEAMHGLVADAGGNSAEVTQILGEIALDVPNPNPFIVFWRYSHPPTGDRMRFAQEYAPWGAQAGPRYIRSNQSEGPE